MKKKIFVAVSRGVRPIEELLRAISLPKHHTNVVDRLQLSRSGGTGRSVLSVNELEYDSRTSRERTLQIMWKVLSQRIVFTNPKSAKNCAGRQFLMPRNFTVNSDILFLILIRHYSKYSRLFSCTLFYFRHAWIFPGFFWHSRVFPRQFGLPRIFFPII